MTPLTKSRHEWGLHRTWQCCAGPNGVLHVLRQARRGSISGGKVGEENLRTILQSQVSNTGVTDLLSGHESEARQSVVLRESRWNYEFTSRDDGRERRCLPSKRRGWDYHWRWNGPQWVFRRIQRWYRTIGNNPERVSPGSQAKEAERRGSLRTTKEKNVTC